MSETVSIVSEIEISLEAMPIFATIAFLECSGESCAPRYNIRLHTRAHGHDLHVLIDIRLTHGLSETDYLRYVEQNC